MPIKVLTLRDLLEKENGLLRAQKYMLSEAIACATDKTKQDWLEKSKRIDAQLELLRNMMEELKNEEDNCND